MTAFVLLNSRLWVDAYDMGGYKNRIAIAGGQELKDHTRFGDSGRRRLAGLEDITLRATGFWDANAVAATNEPDKPIFDMIGVADKPVTAAAQDGNEGSIAYLFRAMHALYRPGEAVGEILKYDVEASNSDGNPLVRATILANKNVAAGGPTNGTAFQVGAIAATQKAYAALHVFGVGTSLDVKIQRDTVGFPSPIDFITFGQKVAIGSEYAAPVVGPQTDDYFRIVYTSVGAPNARFVVVFGIV